jgi:nucleotide-binding universal stress UspA family protein
MDMGAYADKPERLLVCTDGSKHSRAALAAALRLAQVGGGRVYLLQVVQIIPEFEVAAPDLMARVSEEARTELAASKTEAEKFGVALETRLTRSVSVFSAILQEAEEIQPDLILMGRYGYTGLARLLMGSVTARVIGHSPFNVLVIPLNATVAFDRLLIASDGSPGSQTAFAAALDLARRRESKLFGVSVATEEGEIPRAEEIIHQMLVAANQAGVPFLGLMPQGQPADDGIIQTAISNAADLIILGSHGRTGLKRLLMGSVAERVIGQSPCPVLVVKRGKE